MKNMIMLLIFTIFATAASADDDAMLKYKDFTPKELAALPKEELHNSVPIAYSSAAGTGLSKGSELLFAMQLNTLMYPAVNNYRLAIKEFQKDIGDRDTGMLTVSQIYKLEMRSEFQKLPSIFFQANT